MRPNSQSSYFPQQPDNPSDSERWFLARYALAAAGREDDLPYIYKIMSPPHDITSCASPGAFRGVNVGIIGGGLAGLSAAFELRKLGFDITIFDALSDRPGGRVYTYFFGGQPLLHGEFGPMRIPVTHETVWHYLKLFNLPTTPFIQVDNNAFVYLKNTRVRNDPDGRNVMKYIYPKYHLNTGERNVSWKGLLFRGLESHLLVAPPAVRAEIIQIKAQYSTQTLMWDENSSIKMMEYSQLSQPAIDLVSNFSPLLKGNLYNSYIDLIEENYPVDLSYLYEIPGGMVRLPQSLLKALLDVRPGNCYNGIGREYLGSVNWKAGCWVKGINLICGGKKVRLLYQHENKGSFMEDAFDYVVCAIPFSSLRNIPVDPLFSDNKMRAIREVNYSTAQKALVLCNKRFWEKAGIVGGSSVTDLPLSSIWYPSVHPLNTPPSSADMYSQRAPFNGWGVLTGSYSFNLDAVRLSNLPKEMAMEEVKRELEEVHGLAPGYLDAVVEDIKTVNWDEQPMFRGSLCFFTPGQKRLFSYGMTLPEFGERVFFAGEHISAVHRWMQGALHSGMLAANDLAAACKKHTCF